jgi:hypothetical protein
MPINGAVPTRAGGVEDGVRLSLRKDLELPVGAEGSPSTILPIGNTYHLDGVPCRYTKVGSADRRRGSSQLHRTGHSPPSLRRFLEVPPT